MIKGLQLPRAHDRQQWQISLGSLRKSEVIITFRIHERHEAVYRGNPDFWGDVPD